jgi:hypothetical protein
VFPSNGVSTFLPQISRSVLTNALLGNCYAYSPSHRCRSAIPKPLFCFRLSGMSLHLLACYELWCSASCPVLLHPRWSCPRALPDQWIHYRSRCPCLAFRSSSETRGLSSIQGFCDGSRRACSTRRRPALSTPRPLLRWPQLRLGR